MSDEAKEATLEDPVNVDSNHYNVEFENDQVRVLRIKYGPKEKSVMHGHPDSVGVTMTDVHVRFHMPDGNTEEMEAEAGDVQWLPGGDHLPENLSDNPLEVVLVELKS